MAEGKDPADLRVAVIFLRVVRGWDQGELAAAAGVSASLISRYESGDATPTPKTFGQIVSAVGVPASTLERLFAVIRSARAAMRGSAWPEHPAGDVDAIAAKVSDRVFDIARAAAATILEISSRTGDAEQAERPPAEEDRRLAPSLWTRLERRSPEERRMLVEDAEGFRGWALCELLCAKSLEAAPDRTLELAELALLIAELAPGEPLWRSRLQGYALAHVGHARRACGDLAGAGEAFTRARELWEAGAPGDPGLLDEAAVRDLWSGF